MDCCNKLSDAIYPKIKSWAVSKIDNDKSNISKFDQNDDLGNMKKIEQKFVNMFLPMINVNVWKVLLVRGVYTENKNGLLHTFEHESIDLWWIFE